MRVRVKRQTFTGQVVKKGQAPETWEGWGLEVVDAPVGRLFLAAPGLILRAPPGPGRRRVFASELSSTDLRGRPLELVAEVVGEEIQLRDAGTVRVPTGELYWFIRHAGQVAAQGLLRLPQDLVEE